MGKKNRDKKEAKKQQASNELSEIAPEARLDPITAELRQIQRDLRELINRRGDRCKRRILDVLQGPNGQQIIEADRAANDDILLVSITSDIPDLVAQRLAIGKDANKRVTDVGIDNLPLVHLAIAGKSPGSLEAILREGGDPNLVTQPLLLAGLNYLTAMFCGAGVREWDSLEMKVHRMAALLREHGADITHRESDGHCPITAAIHVGHLRGAATLIQVFSTVGPHCQINKMDFPRYIAAMRVLETQGPPHHEAVVPDSDAWRDFAFAIMAAWHPGGWPQGKLPHDLAGAHQPKEVLELLENAVMHGARRTVGLLCTGTAAVELWLKSKRGKEPLVHFALRHNSYELVQDFPKFKVDVTALNDKGLNVLYCACKENKLKFLHELCDKLDSTNLTPLMTHRDPANGITTLGYAVAWGYVEEVQILIYGCLFNRVDISSLLDRHQAVSQHHLPLFSAVVHGYPNILEMLLDAMLDLDSPACVEHVQISQQSGNMLYLREPGPHSESMTLLMCSTTQNDLTALKLLLKAGADPRQTLYPDRPNRDALGTALTNLLAGEEMRNSFRNSGARSEIMEVMLQMHNLEGMPDPEGMLADMMGGMLHDVAPRFECLLLLLWYGAALNHQQLTDLLPVLESYGPQCIECVALARFLKKCLRRCGCCGLFGRWQRCECKQIWYCGKECQRKHWHVHHKKHCSPAQGKSTSRRKR